MSKLECHVNVSRVKKPKQPFLINAPCAYLAVFNDGFIIAKRPYSADFSCVEVAKVV